MKSKTLIAACMVLATVFFMSCDAFMDHDFKDYKESYKDIAGVWQLKTVSRNGIDISNSMNFSQFRLNLNEDGTYTLENYLPFAVKGNGNWNVDDPQYPYNLTLRENSGNEVTIGLKYPIVNGKRIISITLSPGCHSNTYIYVFEKIENN